MQSSQEDRRKNAQQASFPLVDSEGHKVQSERRSGKDRRRNRRKNNVAGEILGIIH
jgi:hypothetical protein